MEKDSDYSSPESATRENSEDENLQLSNKLLIYSEEMKKLNQAFEEKRNMLRRLETFGVCNETFQSTSSYEEWPVSPIASPIHEPQESSEDPFENLPYSPISIESLNQSEVISEPNDALHQASIKESNDISPQKTSDDEIQAARTGAKFTPPWSSTGSEESYDGKGKEAENPKFRYKKRSKPEVSSNGGYQETKVKPSEDASGAQEIDILEAPTSKNDITGIYLSVKRKVLDSNESCSKRISKLSETHADDNDDIKINRQLNFDDDEMVNIQCPNTTKLLSQQKYARSDASEYIVQSRTDQSPCEGEQLALPSTSGLSEVVSYGSSSEE